MKAGISTDATAICISARIVLAPAVASTLNKGRNDTNRTRNALADTAAPNHTVTSDDTKGGGLKLDLDPTSGQG